VDSEHGMVSQGAARQHVHNTQALQAWHGTCGCTSSDTASVVDQEFSVATFLGSQPMEIAIPCGSNLWQHAITYLIPVARHTVPCPRLVPPVVVVVVKALPCISCVGARHVNTQAALLPEGTQCLEMLATPHRLCSAHRAPQVPCCCA
jgi:hypothetical protein